MIAFINGNMVEGSIEEIAKLLGIKLEDNNHTNTDHIPAQSCPPDYNPGFCYPNVDCDSCWIQWRIGQRELELNKGKLVKGEESSGS